MQWMILFPFALGFAAVIQGGLNRVVSTQWGLAGGVFLNSAVVLALSLVVFLLAKSDWAGIPAVFKTREGSTGSGYLWLISGALGFFFVTGVPLALEKIGAFKLFIGIIGAQLVGSLVWDAVMEGQPVQLLRLVGAGLAMAGAWVASLGSR